MHAEKDLFSITLDFPSQNIASASLARSSGFRMQKTERISFADPLDFLLMSSVTNEKTSVAIGNESN
jgi:hypothetical protein